MMARRFAVLWLAALLLAMSAPLVAQPAVSTPSPARGPIVRFAGQLLDAQAGFVFFTTGDAFRIASGARVVDYKTGGPTTLLPHPRLYASASFDTASGEIVELALSRSKIPAEVSYGAIKKFAVALSAPVANPDLAPKNGQAPVIGTGKLVLVTFTVRVPPTTPLNDQIYIATDISNWNPVAIQMDRKDALSYIVTQQMRTGTKVRYRYTRGSWTSAERGATGLEVPPHQFTVGIQDVIRRDDVVYQWADQNSADPGGGAGSIPTPFDPNPFATGFPTRPLPPAAPPHPHVTSTP